jgi:hypothetical protein
MEQCVDVGGALLRLVRSRHLIAVRACFRNPSASSSLGVVAELSAPVPHDQERRANLRLLLQSALRAQVWWVLSVDDCFCGA